MSIARYKCTHCKRTDATAREFGCGGPRTIEVPVECDGWNVSRWRTVPIACPMRLRFLFDRIRYNLFGKLPK